MLTDPSSSEPVSAGLDVVTAIALGAVQGVAEFLPISSSGHLSLAQALLGIDPERGGHQFTVLVHAATLLAVVWVYRRDVWRLLRAVVSLGDPEGRRMVVAMLIGSSPLVIVLAPGVRDMVLRAEGSLLALGCAFWVTAGLLFACRQREGVEDGDALVVPTPRQAILIGLAQLLAVTPGISRAGSTIAAGLAVGLGRAAAARFSFLLSLPAVGAATVLEGKEMLEGPSTVESVAPLMAGFAASFVVGLLSLRLLLAVLRRYGLVPFVPYLVLVGAAALWLA